MSQSLTPQPTLLYIGDPMCSWCWGFSKSINQLLKKHVKNFQLEILLGGLRPTNEVIVDEKMKEFLRHHWVEVNKRSGQKFDHTILDNLGWVYNTEPSCRAVATARKIKGPKQAFHFFDHLQNSYYSEGNIITTPEVLINQAVKFGFNEEEFSNQFNSNSAKIEILEEFATIKQLGVQGFPTLLIIKNDQPSLLVNGYCDYETLEQRLLPFITNE